jgi:hypothetical protein
LIVKMGGRYREAKSWPVRVDRWPLSDKNAWIRLRAAAERSFTRESRSGQQEKLAAGATRLRLTFGSIHVLGTIRTRSLASVLFRTTSTSRTEAA